MLLSLYGLGGLYILLVFLCLVLLFICFLNMFFRVVYMLDFMFAIIVFNTALLFASAISNAVLLNEIDKKYDNILEHIDILTDELKRRYK